MRPLRCRALLRGRCGRSPGAGAPAKRSSADTSAFRQQGLVTVSRASSSFTWAVMAMGGILSPCPILRGAVGRLTPAVGRRPGRRGRAGVARRAHGRWPAGPPRRAVLRPCEGRPGRDRGRVGQDHIDRKSWRMPFKNLQVRLRREVGRLAKLWLEVENDHAASRRTPDGRRQLRDQQVRYHAGEPRPWA